jgi:hypothetical protein
VPSLRPVRLAIVVAATAVLLAGCIPSGPPTPEQLVDQFTETVEPAWEVELEGIFGEPVVRDGLVFMYADDEADGMRLEVRSLEDGELVWEHVAAPAGAYSNPILGSGTSASRTYPYPPIEPVVMERGDGEDAQLVVVYFEREIPTDDTIVPDDFLRVADARTGDLLEVTFEPYDEFELRPYGVNDSGEVFANVQSPARACGEQRVCFVTNDGEGDGEAGSLALDVESLVLEWTQSTIPPSEETVLSEWGLEYGYVLTDDADFLARYVDGAEVWRADFDALFDEGRLRPAEYVDFVQVGDLLLIQGYQSILETLDPGLPHTLELDFAASRSLIAIDPETGDVAWRAPGADMLCHAVHDRPIADDATTIPVCVATAGSFVYDLGSESMIEQTDLEASIAELTVADGSLGWEVAEAGETSVANVGRLIESVWAARGDYAVIAPVDTTTDAGENATGEVQLVDLTTGETLPVADDAQLVCKSERPDVELKFEGSAFASGSNPITTGYPAGWYHFPCGTDGLDGGDWSKGGVRVAGYPEVGGESAMVVLTTEGGLAAFDLG